MLSLTKIKRNSNYHLGRSSIRKTRNSCSDYGYTGITPRDNVIRYSTIGRQKVSPGNTGLGGHGHGHGGHGLYPAGSPIYAPASNYSSGKDHLL